MNMNMLLVVSLMPLLPLSFSYASEIPRDLMELLPVGAKTVRMVGKTENGRTCTTDIASHAGSFSLVNMIPNQDRTVDQLAKLQIGLGHELVSLEQEESTLVIETAHKARASYASDTKSVATISRDDDGFIAMVSVKESEKGPLNRYKVSGDVNCYFER